LYAFKCVLRGCYGVRGIQSHDYITALIGTEKPPRAIRGLSAVLYNKGELYFV